MKNLRSGKAEPGLVTIRTFADESEADLAQSLLRAAGIDSVTDRDDCADMYPPLSLTQGIRLIVRSEDAEQAAVLLNRKDKHSR